ncbi:MAG TPA: hypothetical protein VFN27_16905 [Xanthobacteraceae bacterium]|nr:hypothetical protein [Xanthobacteraceae bacterium]
MIVDKLSIINDALGRTANNTVAVADDGSDEWNAASPAYDAAVENTLDARNWQFAKQVATLVRVGASPDTLFNDAMAMPANALHLIWVRVNNQPADYKVISNQICLNLNNFVATAEFILDSQLTGLWPPLFAEVIRRSVMADLYRGFNEDPAAADKEEQKAMLALTIAGTRDAQQNPKRATFNSRAIAARIVRHPWIRTPFSWGGTGVPD